ncbi:MAG: DUF885 domain-containing protein [Candidatus Geothermarchaeales archaeon]
MSGEARVEFKDVVQGMFDEILEWDPPIATFLGIHRYDHLMPDGSRGFIDKVTRRIKHYRRRLKGFDESDLGKDAVDLRLARDALDLQLFDMEEWRLWSKYPSGGDDIGGALFPLFTRDFAPAQERMRSISERIGRSPQFLDELKERLEDPIKIYCEIGLQSARMMPGFLGVILTEAQKHLGKDEFDSLMSGAERLEEALKDYSSWIEGEMKDAGEEFAIGRERLTRRLRLRGVEADIDEILALGYRYLEEEKRKLKALAEEISPGKSVEEVNSDLKKHHPKSFEEALERYRDDIRRTRWFVMEKDFATIPQKEELRVIETPTFLRHIIPFAAYMGPAKFEEKQLGIYIVTPPSGESLVEHNYYSISNTSIHEGYPGHHLQLSAANQNPSLVRLLARGTEFVEGWAHYCEEAMKDLGFNDTPRHRFVQAVDLVWRAARIVIDVQLSSGAMTFDEAVDFLVEQTGMERDAAIAEVRRYTFTPGQPLSYLLGKHLIKELRREAEEKLGDDFSAKWFHDLLLSSGSIPVKYHREILDQAVHERTPPG